MSFAMTTNLDIQTDHSSTCREYDLLGLQHLFQRSKDDDGMTSESLLAHTIVITLCVIFMLHVTA